MSTKPFAGFASVLVAVAFAGVDAASAAAPRATITSQTKPHAHFGSVERVATSLDALLAGDAAMEKLAEGFNWSEGPVWMPKERQLVFSDVPENVACRWRESGASAFFSSQAD